MRALLFRFKKCATIEQKPTIYQQQQSDFNCHGLLRYEIGGPRVGGMRCSQSMMQD